MDRHIAMKENISHAYISKGKKSKHGRIRRKMGAGWLEQEAAAVVASMNGMMLQKK